MILVQLAGGLANQMGIYAAGRSLATARKAELKLDISSLGKNGCRPYELHKLNISTPIATQEDIDSLLKKRGGKTYRRIKTSIQKRLGLVDRHYYRERSLDFTDKFYKVSDHAYIVGNFMSIRYYENILDQLYDELTVTAPLSDESKTWLQRIQAVESVSVHIRRSDYVDNPAANAFHGVLTLDYYQRAFAALLKEVSNPVFFVFSDDPVWAAENVRIPGEAHYISCNDIDNGYQDFVLMQNCHHHVIANSGFSRWAAQLNRYPEKNVYMPTRWMAKPIFTNPADVAPASWVRIEN